jgi:hypothetical protein
VEEIRYFAFFDNAIGVAMMGNPFIVQIYTCLSFWWAMPDTIATMIGLGTPVLVWAISNKEAARA